MKLLASIKRFGFFTVLLSSLSASTSAQFNIRDTTISFPVIGATFNYSLPGGNLADRFGNNFAAGALFQWKFRSNIVIGIEGSYLFSDQVKENNLFDRFLTPDGNIIDGGGTYGTVLLYERGFKLDFKIGKIFPVFHQNPNSGILATVAAGYLQHKILIDTQGSPIPYLEGDYRKGYDRFTNGPSLTEFIGYMYFGNNKLINFFAGFEFTQGFTQNRRKMNFDTGESDTQKRTDLLFGIKAGWVFPLYKRNADKYYID